MQDVQTCAAQARVEHATCAAEAQEAMGAPATTLSSLEADLRVFCHDALHVHHDKDARSLAALPISLLEDVVLHVWLVDYWGHLREIIVLPKGEGDPDQFLHAWIIIHRMHACALPPKAKQNTPHLDPPAAAILHTTLWEDWVGNDGEEPMKDASSSLACRRCDEVTKFH